MAPSKSSIRAQFVSEEAPEHLYDVTVLGQTVLTTVTKYPEAVTKWINDVNNTVKRRVGFALELYIDNNAPRVGTVQLCVGLRCLVFQVLNPSPCPASLYQFLTDQNNCFAGIHMDFKMERLGQHFSFDSALVQRMDLGLALTHLDQTTLAVEEEFPDDEMDLLCMALATTTLGSEVEFPEVDQTDWGRTTKLSDEQVHYACVEAFLSYEIGRLLN